MTLSNLLSGPRFSPCKGGGWGDVNGEFLGPSSSADGGLCAFLCGRLQPQVIGVVLTCAPQPGSPQASSCCSGWAPAAFSCPRMDPTQPDPARASVPKVAAGSSTLHLFSPPPGMLFLLIIARPAPCLPGFRANTASVKCFLSPTRLPGPTRALPAGSHVTLLYFLPHIYHSLKDSFYLRSCT